VGDLEKVTPRVNIIEVSLRRIHHRLIII